MSPPDGAAAMGGAAAAGVAREPGFRTFAWIWFGQLVSLVGSGLTSFALGVWVYQTTGSVARFALIAVAASVPALLLLPFSGVLVDRWDRRRTMMAADTAAGFATAGVAVLLALGKLEIWHIYLSAAVASVAGAFQWPAYAAATTLLVPSRHLARAAGMVQFARAAAQVAAPMLAGFLVATVGIRGVLLVDFATFLFAAATLWVARIPAPPGERPATGAGPRALVGDVRWGLRYLRERPGLVRLMAFFSLTNLFSSASVMLVTPLVLAFADARTLGLVISAGATGLLLGGAGMSAWGGPRRHVYGVVLSGFVLGASLVMAGARPWVPLVVAGLFLFNLMVPVVNACSQAIWQVKVPPHLQGRIFAMRRMFATGGSPLGYLAAAHLVDRVFQPLMDHGGALAGSVGRVLGTGPGRGIALYFVCLGALCILTATWGVLSPRLMRVDTELPDAVPG